MAPSGPSSDNDATLIAPYSLGVDARTGQLTVTMPLDLPSGRHGCTPSLQLGYAGGAGNGLFGMGWTLSGLPSITVDSVEGLPRYDGRESFALAGIGAIVPCRNDDQPEWQDRGDFRVRRFRPATQRAELRIEQWIEHATGRCHWRTRDAGNTITLFGKAGNGLSRIADPADPSRVFAWLPEAVLDTHGNAIRLDYLAENADGVDRTAPQEASRSHGAGFAQRHLKTVRWGNETPVAVDDESTDTRWHFALLFDFGDHGADPPAPTPDRAWPVRPDAFSSYASGFELRTYRLCRRIMLFHDFDALGPDPVMVRSMVLTHDSETRGVALQAVEHIGHRRMGQATMSRALPPLTFAYAQPEQGQAFFTLNAAPEELPTDLGGHNVRFVDLHGDGLPGILMERAGAWYFRRNMGDGHFERERLVVEMPSHHLADVALQDIDGDGQVELAVLRGREAGFYAFDPMTGRWGGFRHFAAMPQLDGTAAPRWLDLSGDGRADLVTGGPDGLTCYRSRGVDGFAPGEDVRSPGHDAAPWADRPGLDYRLADMTGDGLLDQVLVRNGHVVYWPHLGHGRFGDAIVMDGAPHFASDEAFDPRRLILVDLDGSGTADLLYVGNGEISTWANACGNSLSPGKTVGGLPRIDAGAALEVLDLLGDGTPCLVWSRPGAGGGMVFDYLPLTGGVRPGRLIAVTNGAGGEDHIGYGSSASHFLRDRAEGRAWSGCPRRHVTIVDRLERIDRIGGARSLSTWRYHDGSIDGKRRQWRGFGFVETADADLAAMPFDGPDDADATSPPRLTRQWFHQGIDGIASQRTMWDGDPDAPTLPPVMIEPGAPLSESELDDAIEAAAGTTVRVETFALGPDGQPAGAPLAVELAGILVRRLQAGGQGRSAFALIEREMLSIRYEGVADDPRILHEAILETDARGSVLLRCDLAYPRREAIDPAQSILHVSVQRSAVAHVDDPDRMHLALPTGNESFVIDGLIAQSRAIFDWSTLRTTVAAALAAPAPFEAGDVMPGIARRVGWTRNLYADASGTSALPPGDVGTPPLLHSIMEAAFTPTMIADTYGGRIDATALTDAHYVLEEGHWWRTADRIDYAGAAHFHRVEALRRADGGTTRYTYDPSSLIVVAVEDAAGNVTRSDHDWYLLQPCRVVDANLNITETRYDPLGKPVIRTRRGTVLAQDGTARPYGFAALDDGGAVAATPEAALADPDAAAGAFAAVCAYDARRWVDRGEPLCVVRIAREQLRDDGAGDETAVSPVQVTITHFDGFGRPLQQRSRAGPGKGVMRDGQGALRIEPGGIVEIGDIDDRWRVSGHVVYDLQQRRVRTQDPFFSSGWRFESEGALATLGVPTHLRYDPLGRLIRTDLADGTVERLEHGAWQTSRFDRNDLVGDSAYRLLRLSLASDDPERRTLEDTMAHADTPVTTHLDASGRALWVEESDGQDGVRRTGVRYAPDGQAAAMIDPRGLVGTEYRRDMLGRTLWTRSADAGETLIFHDGFDRPAVTWTARDFQVRHRFDRLDRPVATDVVAPGGAARRVETITYGDDPSVADGAARNLRGVAMIVRDEAGSMEIERATIDGLPIAIARRILADPLTPVDWGEGVTPEFLPDTYRSEVLWDGLGRPVRRSLADGTTLHAGFGRDGALSDLTADSGDGLVTAMPIIAGTAFDARGQRSRLRLGNGVTIDTAVDPRNGRVARVTARRNTDGAVLQDAGYTYDPVGNVTAVFDKAQTGAAATIRNLVAAPERRFRYDALYRLREAGGRAHRALLPGDHRTAPPRSGTTKGTRTLSLNDGGAVEAYIEKFDYDPAGNLLKLRHIGASAKWTTDFWVDEASNRSVASLDGNGVPVADPGSAFDAAGNLARLSTLRAMDWSWRNMLGRAVAIDRDGTGPNDDEHYLYDIAGSRVRRFSRRLLASGEIEMIDTLYLDGCEIRRIDRAGTLILERSTCHVDDGNARVASLYRWTRDTAGRETDDVSRARIRYQLSDQLGSAQIRLDETGRLISYEEYLPYGGSAFIAGDDAREVETSSYRFSGKERDDATGLYYFGQRYYAPWLCRWTSADPAGDTDGLNRYLYVKGNPTSDVDPDGCETAARPGRAVNVAAPVPQGVREAFGQRPDRERLIALDARGELAWFRDRSTGRVEFGTRDEIHRMRDAMLSSGRDVRVLHPPVATPAPNGRTEGGGGARSARPMLPKAAPPHSSPPATGPPDAKPAAAKAADPAQAQDGSDGAAKGPSGTHEGQDGSDGRSQPVVSPGDGGHPGTAPGAGSAAVGGGPGSGARGVGRGGGGSGEAHAKPGTSGHGQHPLAGTSHVHGTEETPGPVAASHDPDVPANKGGAGIPAGIGLPAAGAGPASPGSGTDPVDRPGAPVGPMSGSAGGQEGPPPAATEQHSADARPGSGDASPTAPRARRSVGDRISRFIGYFNLVFGDEEGGESGGVAGGFGSHNWGGWGQAIVGVLTIAGILLMFTGSGAGGKAAVGATERSMAAIGKAGVKKAAKTKLTSGERAVAKMGDFIEHQGSPPFKEYYQSFVRAKTVAERVPTNWWRPRYIVEIDMKGATAAMKGYAETWAHESFHKAMIERFPRLYALSKWKPGGHPVFAFLDYLHEVAAWRAGRIATGNTEMLRFIWRDALYSVYLNPKRAEVGVRALQYTFGAGYVAATAVVAASVAVGAAAMNAAVERGWIGSR